MNRRLFHALRARCEALLDRTLRGGWAARLARSAGLHPDPAPIHVTIALPGPPACPPLRVAFASDFHAGPTTHPDVTLAAGRLLADARPDVLLLGGDYVSFHDRYVETLAPLVAAVGAPHGRFAALGNHDYWADDARIIRTLAASGCEVLTNRAVQLAPPYDHVWICGLDDADEGAPDAAAALTGATGTRLVLTHSPDGLVALSNHAVDLVICGHTHGGQVCLPGGRIVHVPPGRYTRRYAAGQFLLPGGATLIVSRGVGCSGLPLRANATPDVIICDITWQERAPC